MSATVTGTRVMRLPSSVSAATVSSEVSEARMTSTSFISGTGLKKCMPATRSRFLQAWAMRCNRDRRRVRRDDAVIGDDRFDLLEDFRFDVNVFEHGFDDGVAAARAAISDRRCRDGRSRPWRRRR